MGGRPPGGGPGGAVLVATGLAAVAALFVIYGRYQDPELLTPDAVGTIQRIAYGFYVALAAALGAVALGMRRLHAGLASGGGLSGVIASATLGRRQQRIFAVTFVAYGAFFSLASGMLVYQPEVDFAVHYGAEIPSWFVAPCCAGPGYMPKAIIYLTEHVGLQVIPINLVLQAAVSYLVGLNAALAAAAYAALGRGMGAAGAATGLFIACPTCAGTLISVFAGAAGGIAVSAALAQVQTLLIAVSIPVLLATPYVMARGIRAAGRCGV